MRTARCAYNMYCIIIYTLVTTTQRVTVVYEHREFKKLRVDVCDECRRTGELIGKEGAVETLNREKYSFTISELSSRLPGNFNVMSLWYRKRARIWL